MRQTKTAQEWFDTYVNKDKLKASILKGIEEAVTNDSVDEGGMFLGLVHEVVGGNNGRYIPFYALEYFDYENIDTDNIEMYNLEYVYDELNSFTYRLESLINKHIAEELGVMVNFGHWEADGTYCLMVSGHVHTFYNQPVSN